MGSNINQNIVSTCEDFTDSGTNQTAPPSCFYTVQCSQCQFSPETTSLSVSFTQSRSYASAIHWYMGIGTGYPDAAGIMQTSGFSSSLITSSTNSLFRGSDPSALYFTLTPTTFQGPRDSEVVSTGYHAGFDLATLGSQV